jgi:hypothetical protein
VITQQKYNITSVYIKVKAQEWEDIVSILSLLEIQIYDILWKNTKVQFEITRVFQL